MSNFYKIPLFSELSARLREWKERLCAQYVAIRNAFCPIVPLVYAQNLHATAGSDTVLVLPPSDYWALRAELNVSNETEALKYASALFDVGEGYGFQACKVDKNLYLLIAYERDLLTEKLRSNPVFASVEKITFAQWIFGDSELPIRLENGKYLAVVEGIVVELDGRYVSDEVVRNIDDVLSHPPLFYKTVRRDELSTSEITTKTFKITLGVLIVAFINLGVQIVLDYKASEEIETRTRELLDATHLPGTSIEREAILESLKHKEEKQMKFRQQCYELGALPIKVSPSKTPAAQMPAPVPTAAATDGVVLIPGSKPGEPNRLLIGRSASAATSAEAANAAGINELQYDGNGIKMRIGTDNADDTEVVKSAVLKKFKNARIETHDKILEVRLK